MKLVRFGPPGKERPGVLLDGGILDVRAMAFDIEDYDSHFFARHGLRRLELLLKESGRKIVPPDGVRLGPPIARPGKIVCLGKNYADHAAEMNSEIPKSPVLFSKAVTSIIGAFDPIVLPEGAGRTDVEVELAVVIGRLSRNVPEAHALDAVAGYMILDDVTDRDAQIEGKQWFRAKSTDTFCPMGPWLVTPDEAGNPQDLALSSKIDGRVLQESRTSEMIFPVARLIAFITRTITLEPGDVIATGTPGGIGSAHKPPVLLKRGSEVEIGIERLGVQRNRVQ